LYLEFDLPDYKQRNLYFGVNKYKLEEHWEQV